MANGSAKDRRTAAAPKQARSRFLVDAVVEAAERVMVEVGWSGAKVSRIAKVAGVSVGSLYRYFPGRQALLGAVIDRRLEGDRAAFRDALRRENGQTPTETLHLVAQAMLRDSRVTSPTVLRHVVPLVEAASRMQVVRDTFDGLSTEMADHLVTRYPELGSREAMRRRCHILMWGLRGAYIARVRVERPFDMKAFMHDAMRIIESELTAPTKDPTP